jgi:hypothetical protein
MKSNWRQGDRVVFVRNASGWSIDHSGEHLEMHLITSGRTGTVFNPANLFDTWDDYHILVELDDGDGTILKVPEVSIYPI